MSRPDRANDICPYGHDVHYVFVESWSSPVKTAKITKTIP